MLTIDDEVTLGEDVVYTVLDDKQAVLLHMSETAYFSLNQTGARIWQLLEQQKSLGEISVTLADEYDVSLERSQQSVLNLVQELAVANLLSLQED